MRKRYMLLAAFVLVVAVLAFGAVGSGAWFSSTATLDNNTLAAGTLKVTITQEGSQALPFHLTNLEPGTWVPVPLVALGAFNNPNPASTLPCKYQLSFTGLNVTSGPADLASKIHVRIRHTFAGTADPPSWPIVMEGTLDSIILQSTLTAGIVGGGILNPNNTHVYKLEFELDPYADNTYQGAALSLDFKVDAYQVLDPIF